MNKNLTPVQSLYHIGHARWYNSFRILWTRIVERNLEHDFLAILERTITPKTKIVEIGCGTGINLQRIRSFNKEFISYLGIDFSPDMLAVAQQKFGRREHISFLEGDATTVVLPKTIDLVICTWVLSHIPEPSAVVNRCYKNLAKDGTILLVFLTKPQWFISFWFSPFMRFYHSQYVSVNEIEKIEGKKEIKEYACGLATFVVIKKT